jgi:hypothetical protein
MKIEIPMIIGQKQKIINKLTGQLKCFEQKWEEEEEGSEEVRIIMVVVIVLGGTATVIAEQSEIFCAGD